MATPLVAVKFHSTLASGADNNGGKVYTYLAGTTTLQATYTTAAASVANANPVILDSTGRASIYLTAGVSYKFVCQDSTGASVPDGTVDNWIDSGEALRADLISSTGVTIGAQLVGIGPSLAYTPGPTIPNYFKSYSTPLAFTGCVGDGANDDSTYVAAALASGKKEIVIPGGYTFLVDGNLSVPTGTRIVGEGKLKKKSGTIKPVLLLADSASDIVIEGITIDGTRSAYSTGNAVPAILGHLNTWPKFNNVNFENIIDVGIKLRNCMGIQVIGCRFYNVGQSGIEIDNYDVDPRTNVAYVASLPAVQGGHRIEACWFGKIDDGLHGAGDGNGVRMSTILLAAGTAYPIKGVGIVNNDFLQCLRAIWCENNAVGTETEDLHIIGNRIRGDITSYGGETYMGIGVVGVRRCKIAENNVVNQGNFAPSSDTCNGIIVSASLSTTDDVEVVENTVFDTTGNTNRMQYGIKLTAGNNLRVADNRLSGQSVSPILVTSANVAELQCQNNKGAQDSYSWGDTMAIEFSIQNIPGTATTALKPCGYADGNDLIFPMPVRLVGIAVDLNTTISTGTISFQPYTNGVNRSNLNVATADFGVTQIGYKTIALTSGVVVAAGALIACNVVTVGFTPTTADAIVTLIFDTAVKE